jgi:DNA-binding response OmpR family regulator
VVETLCAASIPVAVAVGLGEADRVRALFDAGASRLISYPYLATEVSTLVSQHFPEAERRRAEQAVLAVDDVELNGPAFEVRVSGQIVALPLREFELLRFFMLHADQVVTEEQIRAAVWGSRGSAATAKTIALHVRRLRERIGDSVELVRVRGVGYRLKVVHDTDG